MKKYFLFFLISVVIISGCTTEEEPEEGTYLGGTQGVTVDFDEGAPLNSFEKDDSVPFRLKLKNEGEYDVPLDSVRVQLLNMNFNSWSGLDGAYKVVTGDLPGKSKNFPVASELTPSLGESQYTGTIVSSQKITVNARVCYPYKTEVFSEVCIDSRRNRDLDGDVVCDYTGEKVISGSVSGAPVQVTSITEEFLGSDKLQFLITIDNVANGDVLKKDSECSFNPSDLGLVYIDMPDHYTCRFQTGTGSEGYIDIGEGAKTIYCETDARDKHFEDNLVFSLDYKYLDRTSKEIEIVTSLA